MHDVLVLDFCCSNPPRRSTKMKQTAFIWDRGEVGKVLCLNFSQTFVVWTYLSQFFLDILNDTCSEQTIHEKMMKKKRGTSLASVFHGMHGRRRVFSPSLSPCDPPPGNKALAPAS